MSSAVPIESGTEGDNAILIFFNKWPEFDYSREAEVIKEFKRLCREKQWSPAERRDVKDDLRNALVNRFNEIYGTNDKDLEAWKKLCRAVHVNPVPNTLVECEKAIDATHVNLVDLVDKGEVKRFDTLEKLAEYTREEDKYFPRKNAYAGRFLRKLLREIETPYHGKKGRGRPSGRGHEIRRRRRARGGGNQGETMS